MTVKPNPLFALIERIVPGDSGIKQCRSCGAPDYPVAADGDGRASGREIVAQAFKGMAGSGAHGTVSWDLMMMTLRLAAYVFALAAMAITLPLTIAAGQQGIVVAMLGGTLAVTPYVLVRAIEELTDESVQQGNLT